MFGTEINYTNIINHPENLWYAFWILCGFKMIDYLFNVVYWEYKFYNGGEDFIKFGNKYCKNKLSSGNTPLKK